MGKRAAALAIAGIGLVAVFLYASVRQPSSDAFIPRPEAFELSADQREVTVAYCGSTADTIVAQNVRENGDAVIVSVRMRQQRDVFQNGAPVKVKFTLEAPLGVRIVQDEAGTVIQAGRQYVCPG